MIVERRHTPLDVAELGPVAEAGYGMAFGEDCPVDTRRLAVAHWLLEHGRKDCNPAGPLWGCFNFALGNQDALPEELADDSVAVYRTVPENEGHGARTWTAQHVRRSHASAEDGAEAYWRRMDQAYPEAFAAMQEGNVSSFVAGLKSRGYFTGKPAAYLATIGALVRECERKGW